MSPSAMFLMEVSRLSETILTGDDSTSEGKLKAIHACFTKLEMHFYLHYLLTKNGND